MYMAEGAPKRKRVPEAPLASAPDPKIGLKVENRPAPHLHLVPPAAPKIHADNDNRPAPESKSRFAEAKQRLSESVSGVMPEVQEKAKDLFEKTRHTAIGDKFAALERLGVHWFNRPQLKATESRYQSAHLKAAAAEEKHNKHGNAVSSLKRQLTELDAAPVSRAREKRRAALEKQLFKAEQKQEKSSGKLKELNSIKAGWENKQKTVAERVAAQVEHKSRPYVERHREWESRFKELESHIDHDRALHSSLGHELSLLESQRRNTPLWERSEIRAKIKAVKIARAEAEHTIEKNRTKLHRVEGKMAKSKTRIDKWQAVSNHFGRVAARKRHYGEASQHDKAPAEHQRREHSRGSDEHPGPDAHRDEFDFRAAYTGAPEAPDDTIYAGAPAPEAALAAPAGLRPEVVAEFEKLKNLVADSKLKPPPGLSAGAIAELDNLEKAVRDAEAAKIKITPKQLIELYNLKFPKNKLRYIGFIDGGRLTKFDPQPLDVLLGNLTTYLAKSGVRTSAGTIKYKDDVVQKNLAEFRQNIIHAVNINNKK